MTWSIFDLLHFSIPASVSYSFTDSSPYLFGKILQKVKSPFGSTHELLINFGVETISHLNVGCMFPQPPAADKYQFNLPPMKKNLVCKNNN